jgi:hypothetical protein
MTQNKLVQAGTRREERVGKKPRTKDCGKIKIFETFCSLAHIKMKMVCLFLKNKFHL